MEATSLAKRQLRPTAYLDGLRGLGAVLIFILHNQEWSHETQNDFIKLQRPYSWRDEYHFAALPGIRFFFTGGYVAVPIFFVVSGYVLSAKPLQCIYARDTVSMTNNIASALFRRWFRLFLPILAVMLIWATSWHIFGFRSAHPTSKSPSTTYPAELLRLINTFLQLAYNGTYFDRIYHAYTWAIPEEYRGSVITLCTLLATSPFTTRARLTTTTLLTLYLLLVHSKSALFTTGSLLAETDLLTSHRRPLPQVIWYIPFAIGIYLAGLPPMQYTLDELRRMPGTYPMWFLFPSFYVDFYTWYRYWASLLLSVSVPRIPVLKRALETDVMQYLGGISYALYLVHGPVLWSVGARLYAAVGRGARGKGIEGWVDVWKMSGRGPVGLEVNHVFAMFVLFVISVGLADLATRWIVLPCSMWSQRMLRSSIDREGVLGGVRIKA